MIRQIVNLYFSPTGNCKKIGICAGEVLSKKRNVPIKTIDMTHIDHRDRISTMNSDDLLIVTMPVYAGRLPNKIMPILKDMIEGEETPALAMVTYGNRHYDDALSELCLLLKEKGFVPVAAAALPCEHAFSSKLAGGRPNDEDLQKLKDFVTQFSSRLIRKQYTSLVDIPGNNPPGPYYTPLGTDGMPAKFLKAKPKTDMELCIQCGLCSNQCPMGAIHVENMYEVPGICIKCQACVRNCPQKAKYFDDESFLSHVAMLEDFAMERKESLFLINERK